VESFGIVRREVDHWNQKPHNCKLSCLRGKGKWLHEIHCIVSCKKKREKERIGRRERGEEQVALAPEIWVPWTLIHFFAVEGRLFNLFRTL
jgi:hypothetical protein